MHNDLVALKLETEDIDKGGGLTGVLTQEGEEKLPFFQVALKCFQNHIQNTIWVQVEATYREGAHVT